MIDFPNAPADGQEYTSGDRTWVWRAAVPGWDIKPVGTSDANAAGASAITAATARDKAQQWATKIDAEVEPGQGYGARFYSNLAATTLANKAENADLADTTLAAKGAGRIGFNAVLAYAAGTLGAYVKSLVTASGLAALGGAALVGTQTADDGSQLLTQADINAMSIRLMEFIPKSQHAAILANTSVYDATVPIAKFMAACVARKKIGLTPGGKVCYQVMEPPGGFPGMRGEGSAATWFQHIAGTAGASFRVPAGRLNYGVFENLLFQGYGTGAEGSGLDITGISYTDFRKVKVLGFYGDNWTATGYVVGVFPTITDDRSTIVNSFYDCIGVSSVAGRGVSTYAPLVAYDSAALVGWSFFGGYFVDNAGGQIRLRFGEDVSMFGTKVEASAGGLMDIDACNSFYFRGYLESRTNNMYITIGANATNYDIQPTRWTYPLWGMIDPASVLGRGRIELAGNAPGRSCFANTDFAKCTPAGLPIGITPLLSFTSTGYVTDAASNKGVSSGFSVATGSAQCGFDIRLAGTASRYFGKRLTVRVRYRATGDAGTSMQIRARVAAVDNTTSGQFYSRALAFSPTFVEVIADVVFPVKGAAADTDVPSLRFLLTTFTADVTMHIDELDVYEGGFAYPFGNPVTEPSNPSVSTSAALASIAGWPNVLRKVTGRVIHDDQAGKAYMATGSLPASAWKEITTGVTSVAGTPVTPA